MSLIEAVANAWHEENPAWNTAPARWELAVIALGAVDRWMHSNGPTALAKHLPTMSPEDRLAVLCAVIEMMEDASHPGRNTP